VPESLRRCLHQRAISFSNVFAHGGPNGFSNTGAVCGAIGCSVIVANGCANRGAIPRANRSADGVAHRSANLSWICAWIRRRPRVPCSDYSTRYWM
jgi:hypothetical protein